MNHYLIFSIRFLEPMAHGRCDRQNSEWPPSPLRLFQALVAASAGRWNERRDLVYALPALQWLENCSPPLIVAPEGVESRAPTQFYVPDNSADLVVPAWKRGEITKSVRRTDKVCRPIHLAAEAVYYAYRISEPEHVDTLRAAARSITHLGWGIDMVSGNADILTQTQVDQLQGVRWQVAAQGGISLRVPVTGTLTDLIRKHREFLNRLTTEGFRPVPPLREFETRQYRRIDDQEPRPYCVFRILKPDASGNRAFNTSRRTRDIAAWIRHAVGEVCKDWPDLPSFVHGHGQAGGRNTGPDSHKRFSYLPLPTINSRLNRVEAIRRVLVAAPCGFDDRIEFIRRRLLGSDLTWRNETMGVLNLQLQDDWVTKQFVGSSTSWSSVTPVILDGYDDRNSRKTEKLIQKALHNAGISVEVEFDWQQFGYRAGVAPAQDFHRPSKLNGTMIHVYLEFAKAVTGPISIGAGRYRGFGLFAADMNRSELES